MVKRIRKQRFKRRRFRRFGKKKRYIRKAKRFQRGLNMVAEKKFKIRSGPGALFTALSNTYLEDTGLLTACIPTLGTNQYNRIGSKYMVRYITCRMIFCNTLENYYVGKVSVLFLKEREYSTAKKTKIQDLYVNNDPASINHSLLKNCFRKMTVKHFNLSLPPSVDHEEFNKHNWCYTWKKKVKVFRNINIDGYMTNEQPPQYVEKINDWDYFIIPIYFPGTEYGFLHGNGPTIRYMWEQTFTDV